MPLDRVLRALPALVTQSFLARCFGREPVDDAVIRKLAPLVLSALVLGACSSGGDAGPPSRGDSVQASREAAGPARDACALITKAEANAIVGTSFSVQPRPISDARSACDYGPSAGPSGPTYQGFTLEVHWRGGREAIEVGRSAAGVATEAAGGRSDSVAAGVMGVQRVEGVGDEAYFSGRTMSYARKGDVTLQFQLGGLDNPTPQQFRALAAAALARLPQ